MHGIKTLTHMLEKLQTFSGMHVKRKQMYAVRQIFCKLQGFRSNDNCLLNNTKRKKNKHTIKLNWISYSIRLHLHLSYMFPKIASICLNKRCLT